MEQGQPTAQVLVDDGKGGGSDALRDAQATGKATGEGGLARPQVAGVGDHITGLERFRQALSQGFRLRRTVGHIGHGAVLPPKVILECLIISRFLPRCKTVYTHRV